MAAADWRALADHHFRPDGDEHGSVLVCGVVDQGTDRRLIVRQVLFANDRVDYVPGRFSHRVLRPEFVVNAIGQCCADGRLAYLAVHNHFGGDSVSFSSTDLASHESGYPALVDITSGGPVGGVVITPEALAGDIWTNKDRSSILETIIVGGARTLLRPNPQRASSPVDPDCDRQVRLFGETGQQLLGRLQVAVVGLGGAGSMISQALAHLRVGTVAGIDDEAIERTNLPRIVGSKPIDARLKRSKVKVAERLFSSVHPDGRFVGIPASVTTAEAARVVAQSDAVFLAADSMQARHVVNAVCQQYLIPGFQVGAKVDVDKAGDVSEVYTVARVLFPGGSCLWCAGGIDRTRLQLEALDPAQRKAAQYVPEVPAPSVITLNAMSTAQALNDFLFMFTGLARTDDLSPRWYHPRDRAPMTEPLVSDGCRECTGRRGRGDRHSLPTLPPRGRGR